MVQLCGVVVVGDSSSQAIARIAHRGQNQNSLKCDL